MNLRDIYKTFHLNKNKNTSQPLMELTQNLIAYVDTKKSHQMQENWNNSLNFIRWLCFTAWYQQQQQQKIVYNLMETEWLSTEWKVGQHRNKKVNTS